MKTDRIYLRKFESSDLENIFKGLSHPEVIKYYGISFDTIEATKEQMTWFRDLEKNNTGKWWAVCSLKDDRFLGAGGLNDLCQEKKKAELGFWLLPENWRKGIMTETIPLILNYAFKTLKLKKIEGVIKPENINCKNAIEKLNFKFQKTLLEEDKHGKKTSWDVYTLTNS